MRKMATSPAFRKVGPKVVPPLDRFLHRLTRGRVSMSGAIVPSMVLTTTGRKSGLPRESPLACVPLAEGGWFVVGSNFGKETHPAWTGNLLAEPTATVDYKRTTTEVRARLLDDVEKAEVWPDLVAVWPAFDDYVRGRGLIQGIECLDPEMAGRIAAEAFDRGLLIETAGFNSQVVKILPPLVIATELLEAGLHILEASVEAVVDAESAELLTRDPQTIGDRS